MAFAGNCGIEVDVPAPGIHALPVLFAEEPGLVLEVQEADVAGVLQRYQSAGLHCLELGHTGEAGPQAMVRVSVNGTVVVEEPVGQLRALWEETSFQLDLLQAEPRCVTEEKQGLKERIGPSYCLPPTFPVASVPCKPGGPIPRVAILREEGSNGDREMADAFHLAGFEVWDVTMQDLCSGAVRLDTFRGVAFVGGFSYADVLGSAKGWAAAVTFNPQARKSWAASAGGQTPSAWACVMAVSCWLFWAGWEVIPMKTKLSRTTTPSQHSQASCSVTISLGGLSPDGPLYVWSRGQP